MLRKNACLVLAVLLPGTALADPVRDAVKAGVERCDAARDNRAWLNCFYGAAQPMRASLGLSPAPQASQPTSMPAPGLQVASAPPPHVAPTPPPKPGMFGDLFGPGIHLANGLHVSDITFNKDGTFVLTLEDGEVWKQNSPPEAHAHFAQPASTIVVDIVEGMLGSDKLRIRGEKQTYRVHRLR